MKSISVTVCFPVWLWLTEPQKRFLFASYSQSLSTKHSVDRRTIIQSDWHKKNYGHLYKLTSDQNVKTEYVNDKRGVMISTSVGGTSTGKGGDILITDDPHNPRQAESDIQRQSAIEWFDRTFSTRLDDKKKGAIILVMQRLNENDLSAHIEKFPGWTTLCLQGMAEKRTVIYFPISKKEIVREPGDFLWPDREGEKEHSERKIMLGEYGYAGQYQQNPAPSDGGRFKRWWWRFWYPQGVKVPEPVRVKLPDGTWHECVQEQLPIDYEIREKWQSWDMSFKSISQSKTGDPDYVSGQLWARAKAKKYLLDQVRGQWGFVDTKRHFEEFDKKYKTYGKLVEEKANGAAIIDALSEKISGIIPVVPKESKTARADSICPQIEAGNIYIPHPAYCSWVNAYIEEFSAFPNGANDDQVDSTSQMLNRFMMDGSSDLSKLERANYAAPKSLSRRLQV